MESAALGVMMNMVHKLELELWNGSTCLTTILCWYHRYFTCYLTPPTQNGNENPSMKVRPRWPTWSGQNSVDVGCVDAGGFGAFIDPRHLLVKSYNHPGAITEPRSYSSSLLNIQ